MQTLFFIACLAVGADDPREAAIAAAKVKYATLLTDTEARMMQDSVRAARLHVAAMKRAEIDPYVKGPTSLMRDRGDGKYIPVARQFPNAEQKQRAIAIAENELAKTEATFERWKSGEYEPQVQAPEMDLRRLTVGGIGRLSTGTVLRSEADGFVVLLDSSEVRLTKPVLLKGSQLPDLQNDKRYVLPGVYWVSGTQRLGKQTMLVVERLEVAP